MNFGDQYIFIYLFFCSDRGCEASVECVESCAQAMLHCSLDQAGQRLLFRRRSTRLSLFDHLIQCFLPVALDSRLAVKLQDPIVLHQHIAHGAFGLTDNSLSIHASQTQISCFEIMSEF